MAFGSWSYLASRLHASVFMASGRRSTRSSRLPPAVKASKPVLAIAGAGTRIAGRFLVEALAGSGGMGVVYRARDEVTSRTVALKVHRSSGRAHEGERFARESSLLSQLRHPGIVG